MENRGLTIRGVPPLTPRWFVVAFIVLVLTFLTGTYVTFEVLPKIYTATAMIQVKRGIEPEDGFNPTDYQIDFETIQTPKILLPVIKDLNLEKVWAKQIFKSKEEQLTDAEDLDYMAKILRFDYKRGTNVIGITASSDIPQEAADIANDVAYVYKTERDREEDGRDSKGEEALKDQIDQQQKVVDEAKAKMEALRQSAQMKGVEFSPADRKKFQAEADLDARKTELLQAKEDYDARLDLWGLFKPLTEADFIKTLEAMHREDPNLKALMAQYASNEINLDNLGKDNELRGNLPQLKKMEAERDRLAGQIKDQVAALRRAMEINLQIAQSRITLIQTEIDSLTEKVRTNQNSALKPFEKAQSDFERQEAVLDTYKVRLQEMQIDISLLDSPVKILIKASTPTSPSKPNKSLCLALSALAGIILGGLVATLVELGIGYSRQRLRVP